MQAEVEIKERLRKDIISKVRKRGKVVPRGGMISNAVVVKNRQGELTGMFETAAAGSPCQPRVPGLTMTMWPVG